MLTYSRMLFGIAVALVSQEANAQTLHAILIGDTTDASIGAGITQNISNMSLFLKRIETEGSIPVAIVKVAGADFNCKSISNAVDSLSIAKDDAVLFYYSGHGFRRNSSQTKFPEFDCRRSPDDQHAEMSDLTNRIISKRPRLVLSVADTCNIEVSVAFPSAAAAAIASTQDRKAAFQRLFLNYSGTLMMSGAVPGEYSWYMNIEPKGGFFTNQLLSVINQKLSTNKGDVRWEDIASDATKPIIIPTDPSTYQNPQSAALNLTVAK